MHANTGVKIGVGIAHDCRRRPASRKSGDVDPLRVHAMLADDILGDPRDDRRLSRPPALVLWPEPVPALPDIGPQILPGIGNEKAMLLGKRVHFRAGRKIVGGLRTSMQHHDQCGPLIVAIGGNVKPVLPCTGWVGIGCCRERGPFRELRRRTGSLPEQLAQCPDAFDRLAQACVRPERVWGFRPSPWHFALWLGPRHGVFNVDGAGTGSGICGASVPEHPLNERRRLRQFAKLGEAGRLDHFGGHSNGHIGCLLLRA